MAQIKTLAELTTPDERTLRFTSLGFSTGGTLKPEDAAEFQQQVIAHCDLHPDVPAGTRNSFERLRTLHCYGVLCYEAYTIADDLAWLLLEQALRERFIEFFTRHIPFANRKTGEVRPLVALETGGFGANTGPDALRIRHLLCARGTAELFSGEGVLEHPEHPEEVLLAHLGAGFDAHSVAQASEALTDESTRWRSGFGVVARESGRVLRRPVGLCDRAHEVLVAAAQGHPPDRYRHRQPPHFVLRRAL